MSHCCNVQPACGTNSSWLWIGVIVVALVFCGNRGSNNNNNCCRNKC